VFVKGKERLFATEDSVTLLEKQENSIPAYVPVVVVGGGPTGMAVGNFLGMAGIETLIFERGAMVHNGPRAIAFDDEGLRICQAMGLGDALLAHILQGLSVHYMSRGREFASVYPTSKENGYPLISTFHQPDFEHALLAGLERLPHVRVLFQHTVEICAQDDAGVRVRVRAPDGSLAEVACAYVLACNGGKQALRQAIGIPMTGITYPQQWLVLDYIDDEQRQDTQPPQVIFFCDPQRPAATLTVPHGRRRWEFMLFSGETEEQVVHNAYVRSLLRQVHGERQPRMVRCTIYTFHAVLAERFSEGRIFLLGDAAHMMPPFGGQGMNSCLRDVHNLTWKLALVLRGLASPSILASYHQERHDHVASMIRFSSFLGQIVMPRSQVLAFLRDQYFRVMYAIPYTRQIYLQMRIKPRSRLRQGLLLSRFNRASRRYAGRMLPQPVVQDEQGKHLLLDEVLGNGFALLRLHSHPRQAFAALAAEPWHELGVRFVCICPRGEQDNSFHAATEAEMAGPEAGFVVAWDSEGRIEDFLRHDERHYLLVRPDRYILGAFSEDEATQFAGALRQIFHPE
jgi:3-(3-hydroxy-phenyl)propionate hydroxylase